MNHEAMQDFADAAQAYGAFVDSIDRLSTKEIFRRLEALLTDLLAKAVHLPMGDGSRLDADRGRHDISHDEWRAAADRIARALGEVPGQLADRLADPDERTMESDDSSRARFLWDDLADIDRDLRVGLAWWKEGTDDARSEACWQWRFNYEIHWGYHAIRALYTVHQALYLIEID